MSDKLLNKEFKKDTVDYQAQAAEYLAGWQRARADYQNLKKETDAKVAEYIALANKELLLELLPLVDYFKNAFKHLPKDLKGNDWVEGVRHIQSKLEQVLAYAGVKEMEVVGEKFDPEVHESVGEVEVPVMRIQAERAFLDNYVRDAARLSAKAITPGACMYANTQSRPLQLTMEINISNTATTQFILSSKTLLFAKNPGGPGCP